jgi:signal transduction histidine kinase
MGLFIVRHLVEANGGAVRYEQAAPRGARLVVTLEPAQGVAAPSAPSDAAARTA